MHAVRAALPELDRLGHDAVAAPVVRQRYGLTRVLRLVGGEPRVQLCARGDDTALARSRRADLRALRPRVEIGLGHRARQLLDAALDAHAALEPVPPERRRRERMRSQRARLARVVVRVEAEAALVIALQQHDARGRAPVLVDRREHHRGRLDHADRHRLREPGFELGQRIGQQGRFKQWRIAGVLRHGRSGRMGDSHFAGKPR